MTTTKEAHYVLTENWVGLYIDRELVAEGESVNLPHLLDGLTVEFRVRSEFDPDQNWLDNVGAFPESFEELLDNEIMWKEDNR